jgi:glycosyltransferase involved in cell wall biosynthesis
VGSVLSGLRECGVDLAVLDVPRQIDPVRDSAAAIELRRLVVSGVPDVLHLHSSKAGALGRLAMVGLDRQRPAIVYTPHAYAFLTQAGIFNRWGYWCAERVLQRWTDCVVAVSKSEGRAAASIGAGDGVVVIPNGIDAKPPPLKRTDRSPGRLRVGWLGRMTWQKQPETAVSVSNALSDMKLDHQLLLAGEGPRRGQVLRAIRRARAEDRIRLLGHLHDTDAFYAEIDVLLMTSQSEGLPYAGLDAMANGIPIVGFDVPGVQDLVEHGVTGLLAPPGDASRAALELSRLARDADLRLSMGAAASDCVRNAFRLGDQIDQLCTLYRSLASKRPTSLTRH